jgi:cell division protein FtsW
MTARSIPRPAPPLEHRILVTVTLCLLAFGAVMVFSASSSTGVLGGSSYGTTEFFTYLFAAGIGLIAMRIAERRGLRLLNERVLRLLLVGSFALLLAVMLPGLGVEINGARRWFAVGPLQFQPSELMKLALVLYVARHLADHPRRMRGFKQAVAPIAVVLAPACLLIAIEPDLGTMLVVVFTIGALMLAAGMPLRYLAMIAGAVAFLVVLMVMASPYQRIRLLSFLHPFAASCKSGSCYQAVQGQIAIGSGGPFGVGLGKSVQKAYFLPDPQTDFILAVVGEELGVFGIVVVACLYGLIAFAGLRTARRAGTRYAKLLASGLTSLILCQGTLNIFVVLGIAPLTGVPLPFISYAPTNLVVMLVAIGLLLGISRPAARELRAVQDDSDLSPASPYEGAADLDRRRRHGGARRAGAGGRPRTAS